MNDSLSRSIASINDNQLENRASGGRAEKQPAVALQLLDHHRVANGVFDVVASNAVLEGGRPYFHCIAPNRTTKLWSVDWGSDSPIGHEGCDEVIPSGSSTFPAVDSQRA
jgi:hypothetical protein